MGNFYHSSRMLIGPAVDEAAKLYDISNWIGISVSAFTALTQKYLDTRRS